MKNIKKIIFSFFLTVLFISGCGRSSQPDEAVIHEPIDAEISEYIESSEKGINDNFFYYTTKEYLDYEFPYIENDWIQKYEYRKVYKIQLTESEIQGGIFFARRDTKVIDNKLYILDDVCGEKTTGYILDGVKYEYDFPEYQLYGYSLTIFDEEMNSETFLIKRSEIDPEGSLIVTEIAGADENGLVYFYVHRGDAYYLGTYGDEGFKLMTKLPDQCRDRYSCVYENEIYFYGERESPISLPVKYAVNYDLNTEKTDTRQYDFNIKGYSRPDSDTCLLYGIDKDGIFYIYDLPENKEKKAIALDLLTYTAEKDKYQAAVYDEDIIYITNGRIIWTVMDDHCVGSYFSESGILADKVYGMSARKDGFLMYARYNGKDIIYTSKLMKGSKTDKQVVRYAVAYIDPVMEEFIALYNMGNPDYEVVMETAEKVSVEDFAQDISVQTAAGKGPELIDDLLVDPLTPCRNGTYAVLDDIVEQTDNEDIVSSVMESGKVDGHQYGIPWSSTIYYCVAPEKLLKGKNGWNLDECIKTIEASDYSYFGIAVNYMMTPQKIIMYLGLYDTENTELIDWENGQSNLEGEEFKKLLEFAKKYGSDEVCMNYQNDEAEYAKVVSAACDYFDHLGSVDFNYYQQLCKQDNGVWIGFPGMNGSAQYIYTACAYVNEGSKNKDGAKAFLAYLISKEGQEEYAKLSLKHDGYESFSVSAGIVDIYAASYNKNIQGKNISVLTRNGKINIEPLTDEMIAAYKDMLINSRPIRKEISPIEKIVEEELEAFLQGYKTADETAKIIDSRVQIYLDETKK